MAPQDLSGLYETKETGYFDHSRPEMLSFVPASAVRVLDVGCGAGAFGASLKALRRVEVWGVEMNRPASERAASRLDRVLNQPFGPEIDLPANYFDGICFLDILEHAPNPEALLRVAAALLRTDGRVIASIPNFRYFDNMWELLVRKSLRYQEQGVMDRTHLRVFTASSVRQLFIDAGLEIESCAGINRKQGSHKFALFNALTLGWISDMGFQQFAIVARRRGA